MRSRLGAMNITFWRIWVPAALCLIGIVVLIADGFDLFGVSAFAAFVGAGLSVALTNVLWRIGISGNTDRDDEEDARRYLAEHGEWPQDAGVRSDGFRPRDKSSRS